MTAAWRGGGGGNGNQQRKRSEKAEAAAPALCSEIYVSVVSPMFCSLNYSVDTVFILDIDVKRRSKRRPNVKSSIKRGVVSVAAS